MSEQMSILAPVGPTRSEQPTIQARLIARAGDPETSKAAARRVVRSENVNTSWGMFRYILEKNGPLTCNEASRHLADHSYWAVEWDKRVKAWANSGHIRCIGERDGSRVWEVAT